MKKIPFLSVIFILLVSFLNVFPAYPADDSSPEKITDISDRKYEQVLIDLLDNAKESIVVSMYGISLGFGEKNPVMLLLNDLLEARKRGVSVTMYLNTRFRDTDKSEGSFIGSPVFKELKDSGCDIYLIPSCRKLHDKLIIVDSRYVVIGSTNWSNSALRRNFESNTLIDSPRHAGEKLKRLEDVLKFVKSNTEISGIPDYLEGLPEGIFIPEELLVNKKYFSRMVTGQDERVFDLYLLLLGYSQLTGEDEFFINME
ncbi:MAG: phospholipase D-like domain-containing protein, partial [Candidatus Omnitrophota bacterium]|nr:phospholipase D-like domain-containing protein [Candidatus Omnitrophota bacterium]